MKLLVLSMLILGGFLFSPALPTSAQAENNIGLSIVPAIVDLPLASSESFAINVTNISEQSLPVRVGVRALTPFDPNVDPSLRARYDASLWLKPETSGLVLAPRETASVTFEVEAPPEAGPGGHYALVVFRVITPEPVTTDSNANVNPEITSIVLLTLPGEITEAARLELIKPQWQWSPQYNLSLNLINAGNVHILPQSKFVISDLSGETQATLSTVSRLILPGTASKFEVDWRPEGWGVYRLQADTSFGTPLTLLSSPSYILVIWPPIWIQLVATAFLASLALLTRQGLKRVRRRLRRPRRLARDSSDQPAKLHPVKMDELTNQPGTRDIARKKR